MSDKIIKVVVGILLNKNNQVLLTSRPVGKVLAGHWEFPGGKIESSETLQQAVTRELSEELGIEVLEATLIDKLTQEYSHGIVELSILVVLNWRGEVKPCENQELSWHNLADKLSLNPLLPTTQLIFDKLRGLNL